ncbi:hypothetical protein, partial [Pseudomonas typographi]
SLLLAEHMRSHTQQPRFQPNTLLAVVPLARLPGPAGETPRGALPRPGRLYLFQRGRLWRELLCDGHGNLRDVDVAHWRQQAEAG